MNAEYSDRLKDFLKAARLPAKCEFSFKPVFGAVAAYANGQIFASCGKLGVALKLPDEICRTLLEGAAAQPLKYFEKGHIKRNYAVLGDDILSDKVRTRQLIKQSVTYALTPLKHS